MLSPDNVSRRIDEGVNGITEGCEGSLTFRSAKQDLLVLRLAVWLRLAKLSDCLRQLLNHVVQVDQFVDILAQIDIAIAAGQRQDLTVAGFNARFQAGASGKFCSDAVDQRVGSPLAQVHIIYVALLGRSAIRLLQERAPLSVDDLLPFGGPQTDGKPFSLEQWVVGFA